MKEECLQNDQMRSYVVSSPSNGIQSEKEGYIAKQPYDVHFGDSVYLKITFLIK